MITSSLVSTFWISGGSASSGDFVEDAGDAVADIVGGRVHVAADVELDGDPRSAVLARRLDELDPLDAGDAVLDHLGDPVSTTLAAAPG